MVIQNLQVTENVKVQSLAHHAPSRVQNLVFKKRIFVKVLLIIPILTFFCIVFYLTVKI